MALLEGFPLSIGGVYMKILNSTGCDLAVFIKLGNKELPRFNTIQANSEMTIHSNIDIEVSIGFYSLDSKNNIVITHLLSDYSVEEKKGFILEELNRDEYNEPYVQILNASNFS